eukprot:CAMPEP_0119552302 /NCGR_PEP_ID=MMETSP1352-20130426/5345_1 /TAXON_ID=265584 /ORGANISM="Stauroneis constricta, Strain CCMP1120" /LENGTH=231 /DNA_ID=CAMNT_0007598519 /DNA_START=89 /DNA_END=784 /DNA_ORIENTATION=-
MCDGKMGEQTSHSQNNLTEAERNLQRKESPFFKFVLTGGPCGGKTTAIDHASTYLKSKGFEVIIVPETFTLLASNGMSKDLFSTEGMVTVIQNKVMDLQIAFEDSMETVLRARGRPAVLLCDRGPMDGAAYLSPSEWQDLLQSRGMEEESLNSGRYNAVFHMVTAADGAEAYYTLENNAARTETADEAIALDKRTMSAWDSHPEMHVFDNSTDFEGKLDRLVSAVAKIVGI